MPLINGMKLSCEPCIRGHRATSCAHRDRVLIEVRKPGRPLQSCEHNLATCSCGRLQDTLQIETIPHSNDNSMTTNQHALTISTTQPASTKKSIATTTVTRKKKVTKRRRRGNEMSTSSSTTEAETEREKSSSRSAHSSPMTESPQPEFESETDQTSSTSSCMTSPGSESASIIVETPKPIQAQVEIQPQYQHEHQQSPASIPRSSSSFPCSISSILGPTTPTAYHRMQYPPHVSQQGVYTSASYGYPSGQMQAQWNYSN